LIENLPHVFALEISKLTARGVSPAQILEEMEDVLFGGEQEAELRRRPRKKRPFNLPPPEQRSLF
jgi:hypothetical protein